MTKIFQSADWRLWDMGKAVANGKPNDFPRRFRLERRVDRRWRPVKTGIGKRDEFLGFVEQIGAFILQVYGQL